MINRKILISLAVLFLFKISYSATLYLKVVDANTFQGVGFVDVIVAAFSEGSDEPIFNLSSMYQTTSNGEVSINLASTDPTSGVPIIYKIGFSKWQYLPTISQQIKNNQVLEVRFNNPSQVIDLRNTPFIMRSVTSQVFPAGRLTFKVFNSRGFVIPPLLKVILELRHKTTDEMVTFKIILSSGSSVFNLENIPPAEKDTYKLSIYIPETNEGAEVIVSTPVLNGETTFMQQDIYLGYVSNMRSEGAQQPISPLNIAFEGIVLDQSSKPISNCRVEIRDVSSQNSNWNYFITMTDNSGKFFVPAGVLSAPAYFSVWLVKSGYKAKFDKASSNEGYYYDGVNRIILPKYILEEAMGILKGKVWIKKTGDPIWMSRGFPDVKITLSPEVDKNWQGPYISIDGSGLYNTVSGGNGLFEIKGISPGQYNLIITHPLLSKNTTYWKGSGTPNSSEVWNYKYEYNSGNNQKVEYENNNPFGGKRTGDDRRIVIASDTLKLQVFDVYGSTVDFDFYWNDERLHIYIDIDVFTNALIKGNFYFPTDVNIPEEDAIKVIAHPFDPVSRSFLEDRGIGTLFFANPSGMWGGGNHKPIEIEVSTGTYFVEVKSNKWIPTRNYNTTVIVSTPGSIGYLPDIHLTRAGRLEGKIKLPDGSYFQAKRFNDGSWLEGRVEVVGINVDFGRDFKMDERVQDPTKFVFDALPAGMYNLKIWIRKGMSGTQNAVDLYPAVVMSNVRVYADQTTYVEATVKDGVLCEPLSPIPPDKPEVDYSQRANKNLPPNYGIVGFPTEMSLKGQILQYLVNNQGMLEDMQIPVLGFDIVNKKWQQTKIIPGKYNFYLILLRFFGTDSSYNNAGPDEYITVLSKAENVEIKTEDLLIGSTFQIHMGAGVMGSGVITGRIKGSSMLTLQDREKIRNNFKEFLSYIPTVMIYDMDGNWRGYSAARPKLADLPKWEAAMNNGDVWTINNMINSDDSNISSPVYYYIDNLPIGKYILVCETKNYPVVTKIVNISTGITYVDINFDEDAPLGIKLTGYVKDENDLPIQNANIIITHRLANKKTTTDENGKFEVLGLPSGIIKIDVSKDGYAISGEKVSIGKEDKEVNIKLKKANGKILGKVYVRESSWSRRNVYSGAKIIAYNETENVLNSGKYLPSIMVKTQDDGSYIIPDVIVGNTYYVYAFVPERPVYYRLVYVSSSLVSNIDFDIKPSTPALKITMKRTENPYVFKFIIESPRPLVSVPECYYSAGTSFNPDKKIRALPFKGAKNTYNLDVEIPQYNDEENYTLYVKAQYGMTEYMTETITFSQKSSIKTKKELSNELAEGGSILIDDERSDNTEAQLDPGTLIPEEFSSMPIGGFLSSLPMFKMSKTSRQMVVAITGKLEDIVASDIYEMNLSKAQVNKSFLVSLNYDRNKVKESELEDLRIYYYDETDQHRPWKPLPGTTMVDPLTATVSVETDTLEPQTSNGRRSISKSVIRNGVYSFNPQATTTQTGIFAVFRVDPSSAGVYNGVEFKVYNFPNPFDLKEKNVYLYDAIPQNQTTKGTIIKYFLPKGKDGELKFYIYNLAGELVKVIDVGEKTGGHFYYTEWDGTNEKGDKCASGVYFLVVKLKGEKINNKPYKMVILK